MIAKTKSERRIAAVSVAVGVVCYIVNLVVYVPRFSALLQATEKWNFTVNHTPLNPAAYGLDYSAFIISPILTCAAYTLVLVGGGYLFAVLVARIARQLGYLKNGPDNAKQQN